MDNVLLVPQPPAQNPLSALRRHPPTKDETSSRTTPAPDGRPAPGVAFMPGRLLVRVAAVPAPPPADREPGDGDGESHGQQQHAEFLAADRAYALGEGCRHLSD